MSLDFNRVGLGGSTDLVWKLPPDLELIDDDQAIDIGLVIQSLVNGSVEGFAEAGNGSKATGIIVHLTYSVDHEARKQQKIVREVKRKRRSGYVRNDNHPLLNRMDEIKRDFMYRKLEEEMGRLGNQVTIDKLASFIHTLPGSTYCPSVDQTRMYLTDIGLNSLYKEMRSK